MKSLTNDGISILVEELEEFLQAPQAANTALPTELGGAILAVFRPASKWYTADS